ncbi:MAG TPA: hypothetical protein VNF47_01610 [Streptosporangiaceae bacterium]|nr:hypothetical protein [Streptosporangiaceae bacterium]
MTGEPTPAGDLRGSVRQAIHDLAEVAQWLPGVTADESGRGARILERLSEELAESAAMVRALSGRPAQAPGYTFAAIATAFGQEGDFGSWLATVLCHAAARRGGSSVFVAGRPGSWEPGLLLHLVPFSVGPGDEWLAAYIAGDDGGVVVVRPATPGELAAGLAEVPDADGAGEQAPGGDQ